jgi:glycosyltransferase involved in cell wall biosynthesis
MKITIVTVCFNEESNIARTVESVLNQTSSDFEYIICDGASKDKTVEIAKSYSDAFMKKGIKYIVNSEKDKGIYDGMNKGIDLASEQYIYFLNAGDWFCSNDIIEKVSDAAEKNGFPDVIYGNVYGVERTVVNLFKSSDDDLEHHMICHQGISVSTVLMKEKKFDLNYRIAADYKFVLGLKREGKMFFGIDLVVAYFSLDGVSTKNIEARYLEHAAIQELYGIPVDNNHMRKCISKESKAQKIKNLMPLKLWRWWSVKVKGKTLLDA